MSEQTTAEVERIERPQEIDDGALLRVKLIRPVEKAASPIIDHNLELLELVGMLRRWYLGKIKTAPSAYLSQLLNPDDNRACTILAAFIDTVKRFKPGAFPAHCDAVRELEFTTVRLIRALMEIVDAPVFLEALKRVGALFATLEDPVNFTLSDHDFRQRLDARLTQMIDTFREIARVFKRQEITITFSRAPAEPVTKDEVRQIVKTAAKDEGETTREAIHHATKDLKSQIKRSTEGSDAGCHHRNKSKDRLVQETINFLARPGVVFSIHNACTKICSKSRKRELTWLYDWCHSHKERIHAAVDILRAQSVTGF